jgi:hypothetical protein
VYTAVLGMAWGLMGATVGWQPLPGGGMEYLIQIEPNRLELFKEEGITSDVPSNVQDIRSVRVVVGNADLPKKDPPKQASSPRNQPSADRGSPKSNAGPSTSADLGKPSRYGPAAGITKWFGLDSSAQDSNAKNAKPSVEKTPDDGVKKPGGKKDAEGEPRVVDKPALDGNRGGEKAGDKDHDAPSKGGTEHVETASGSSHPGTEPSKPWAPLTFVTVLLFGSMAGNLYLSWIAWEARKRYRALLRRRRKSERPWSDESYESDSGEEE